MKTYSLGLDFGTNSCRSLIVDLRGNMDRTPIMVKKIREINNEQYSQG